MWWVVELELVVGGDVACAALLVDDLAITETEGEWVWGEGVWVHALRDGSEGERGEEGGEGKDGEGVVGKHFDLWDAGNEGRYVCWNDCRKVGRRETVRSGTVDWILWRNREGWLYTGTG